MKLRCLIIDDEPLARKRLHLLLKKNPEFYVLEQCGTGKKAIELINKTTPDVIFLDIQMKDMNGFDVLKKITVNKMPLVIFVTAFDSYAVKAFDFFAFDYLLKPYKRERFQQAINRALDFFINKNDNPSKNKLSELLNFLDAQKKKELTPFSNKIAVKTNNVVSFINIEEIKYITASGSYANIHTTNKTYLHRISLNKLISSVENHSLYRIHRSTIINTKYISNIIHSNFSEIDVKMTDGKLLRVSKSHRKDFQKVIGLK